MKIKAFFLPQGMIIGDVEFVSDKKITVRNPALVITRQNDVVLAPFLQLVDEKEVSIETEDLAFKQVFTPKIELINHYNQVFGSGIVVANVLPL